MEIHVSRINVYGNTLAYPEGSVGKLFCQLTGRKTLTQRDLKTIKELGYTVVEVLPGAGKTHNLD